MAVVHVTAHAAERWIERVAPEMTLEEARAAIRASEPVIVIAAEFGCGMVKLPSGARLVLDGTTVVTVTPPNRRRAYSRSEKYGSADR